jgi:DNA-binding transcriptional regulator YiaG
MSFTEKDHKQSVQNTHNFDRYMAQQIASALRQDYGDKYSSVKEIARRTNASVSTVKKWYEGRNPPNSKHLIILAQHSRSVLVALLDMIGSHIIQPVNQHELSVKNPVIWGETEEVPHGIYTAKSCGINLNGLTAITHKLNKRQLWFLGELRKNNRVKAGDITSTWLVSVRSAETDVAKLIKLGFIRYIGSRKKGWYEAV